MKHSIMKLAALLVLVGITGCVVHTTPGPSRLYRPAPIRDHRR